jgi:NADH dehydrogenase [ubiquinone] 1 alpha subcomplex assembly factor 7
MSALGDQIKQSLASGGAITVERFMELALADPQYGYYMTRDPLGTEGDFTTAPEISQMFGELIGLWAAEVWTSMGRPNPVRVIELGPGRGTLMSDALRAARVVPEFRAALDVTLIETSPPLAQMQYDALLTAGAPIAWRGNFAEAPEGPAIILANEFLDALPVRQYERRGGQWRERVVRLDRSGEFVFDLADKPEPYLNTEADEGAVIEVGAVAHHFMFDMATRLAKQGGAALFLDYGHAISGFGDTLQALRAHTPVSPLFEPGECDITAHVDFAAMARSARAAGATVHGPIDQGDFLRALGIDVRARALGERSPDRASEIDAARRRLVGKGENEMGALFKAMAVANRAIPAPPGFQPSPAKPE